MVENPFQVVGPVVGPATERSQKDLCGCQVHYVDILMIVVQERAAALDMHGGAEELQL